MKTSCKGSRADPLESALLQLYAAGDFANFPGRLIAAARALFPDCAIGYGVLDPATGAFRYRGDLEPLPWVERLEALIHEDPSIQYLKGGGQERVVRIGDFVSFREFCQTRLYQECFRPMGVRHQLVLAMPLEGVVAGVIAHRDGHDFSEAERAALCRLWPHAALAYRNARLLEALRAQNAGSGRADETAEDFVDALPAALRDAANRGLAWLEADGFGVLKLNPVGVAWLARFFPPGVRGSCLPERLRQALSARRQGGLRSRASVPWRVESACGRLVVRAFPDPERRGILLVLDLLPSFGERLAPQGLTPREAEVLAWVAQGKTDAEIAAILETRPRTIEKHVARILAKLAVENRTAAALAGTQAGF
jgi:DNA-binding CsgD family transcriptional regulator